MFDLFTTFGVGTVLICLLIGIPLIVAMIGQIKALWSKRQAFWDSAVEQGHQEAEEENEVQSHEEDTETRIRLLEENLQALTALTNKQNEQLALLQESDRLAIKAWIKEQHDIWMPRKSIDSQVLYLLEERYSVYVKEDGNSWAGRLMADLRTLPVIILQMDMQNQQ